MKSSLLLFGNMLFSLENNVLFRRTISQNINMGNHVPSVFYGPTWVLVLVCISRPLMFANSEETWIDSFLEAWGLATTRTDAQLYTLAH